MLVILYVYNFGDEMIVYVSTLFFTMLVLSFTKDTYVNRINVTYKIMYFFIALMLICVSGFRYYVGTDYYNYAKDYYLFKNNDIDFLNQPALAIVSKICSYIYDDYASWFLIMSIITVLPVIVCIIKRNQNIKLCILFYIILGCWHLSFNIVKQAAAASVLLCGYVYLKDRKLKQWFFVCILASTFHISAIIMFPVFFLIDNKINHKRIVLVLLIGIIVALSYDRLFDIIVVLKQGKSVVSEYSNTKNNAVNFLRIMVNCAPIIFFYTLNRRYKKNMCKDFYCLYYLSFLNAVLNIASMRSVYLYRFCCYTNIYNIFFLPLLLELLLKKERFIKYIIISFYIIFWWYDLYKGSTTVEYNWIFSR